MTVWCCNCLAASSVPVCSVHCACFPCWPCQHNYCMSVSRHTVCFCASEPPFSSAAVANGGEAPPDDHQFGSRVNECKYGVYEPAACMLPTTTKVTVLPKILPDAHCSVTLAQCCTCSYTLLLLQPLDKTFLYLGI